VFVGAKKTETCPSGLVSGYFLDDHLLGNRRFAAPFFDGMRGMGRVFQGASTVAAILQGDLIERAAEAGMRSVFVGFESLDPANLRLHAKRQNLSRSYDDAIRRCHELGVMVNGSFVFGLDADGPGVFQRTVDWAVSRSVETATFHIMTPYPGTALHQRMTAEGRITETDWDLYDTRHVVYAPRSMTATQLVNGYWEAYRDFYRWPNIIRGARGQETAGAATRHLLYAGGWKKFEPLWDRVIKAKRVGAMLPLLEQTLDAFGRARRSGPGPNTSSDLAETVRSAGSAAPSPQPSAVIAQGEPSAPGPVCAGLRVHGSHP
jgi:radical SAM superfamily enzyme YgiQ (UPF0313 family)